MTLRNKVIFTNKLNQQISLQLMVVKRALLGENKVIQSSQMKMLRTARIQCLQCINCMPKIILSGLHLGIEQQFGEMEMLIFLDHEIETEAKPI